MQGLLIITAVMLGTIITGITPTPIGKLLPTINIDELMRTVNLSAPLSVEVGGAPGDIFGNVHVTRVVMPEDRFSMLADYAYSEALPPEKPADLVKRALDCFPEGSVKSEIALISDTLGLDVGLMSAFARIESDFNPHERTGSYIGLYQLSKHEFDRYGPTGGDILNARDNAIAAALKIEVEANLFKVDTRHIPSNADLYLIHQQGMQGAAQHLAEPERPAWQSMCATDEGKQRGKGWCKKAIWGNTLPAFKSIWKSVESFTSGAFVRMWADRVAVFLGHKPAHDIVQEAEQNHEAHDNPRKLHEARVHRHHHRVAHHRLRHYAGA